MTLKQYTDKKYPRKKFKNAAERRDFLKSKKVNLQPDERGVLGVAIAAKTKKLIKGRTMEANKVKTGEVNTNEELQFSRC